LLNSKTPWEKAVYDKFGFRAEHLTLSHSVWIVSSWDKAIYPELANDNNLISKLDRLFKEQAESPKQNEGPLTNELIAGKNHFIQQSKAKNILTNVGMTEMAKRSTAETATTNDFHGVGTGTTTETVSDIILEAEVGRKIIGSKTTVNQTERYASSFSDTDITSPPQDISEAGIFTLISGGILIMRITATPVELDLGKLVTVQTNITHQNGTEL